MKQEKIRAAKIQLSQIANREKRELELKIDNKLRDQQMLQMIGFSSKTNLILSKNKRRAKPSDQEKDFKKAWTGMTGKEGETKKHQFFLNRFYVGTENEKSPARKHPPNTESTI